MKNIHDDLSSLDLGIYEARDLAQNRPLWRLIFLHSAYAQRYALVVVHATIGLDCICFSPTYFASVDGSVAEWLACWTQAQKGPGSNRSRDAVQ